MEYIVTRPQLTSFLKRRFSIDELNELLITIKHKIDDEGVMQDMVIYNEIRNLVASKMKQYLNDTGIEQDFWDSYLVFETPLVEFVKSSLNLK